MNLTSQLTTHNSQLKNGFTLVELLVAVAIVGLVSVVSVNLLFSSVLNRARQNSIQYSSEDVRSLMELFSKSVKETTTLPTVSSTQISTFGNVCRIFRFNSAALALELAEDASGGCNPTAFTRLTDNNTKIYAPGGGIPDIFSTGGSGITLKLSGNHKDSFGQHEFSYNTTVVQRTN